MKDQFGLSNDLANLDTAGFSSFSHALRATLHGELDPADIARYQDALIPRLASSRLQLRRVSIPQSVVAWVGPVVARTEALFDKLGSVLELVEDYLHEGSAEALEEAISLLDRVDDQWRKVF